ncbi:MAG: hypothetical protein ACOCVR_00040 [Myxococcota bacterium]
MKCSHAMTFALAVAALMTISGPALSQTSNAGEMSYHGHLDLDGVPMNGLFNFRFEIYSHESEGDCSADPRPATCLWTEEHVDVQVAAGIFSVVLGGAGVPLPDSIWQSPETYLGIRVSAPDEPYVSLSGRQRILSLPAAARADGARDYVVTGSLTVEGDADVQGELEVQGGAVVRGGLVVDTPTPPGHPREFTVDAAGKVTLQQVEANWLSGSMAGQVIGGMSLICDWDRTIRRECEAWGSGSCDDVGIPQSPCGISRPVSCAAGKARLAAMHRCYHSINHYFNYCYFYLCIRE